MVEMLLAFCVMGFILLAMSVGVIMGRKPLKGSCGGVAAALGQDDYICDICGGDPNLCENELKETKQEELGYNVGTK